MNDFPGVKNILVIKLRHIGDVLLCVPAIRALKESFPASRVSVLVNPGTEEMLTENPLVDEVISLDRGASGLKRLHQVQQAAALRGRRFDMTVDLTGGDRAAFLGFLTGARYRLGYDPVGEGFAGKRLLYTHLAERPSIRLHNVLRDLGVLRSFGVDTNDLRVDIHASQEDEAYVQMALEERGIRPGERYVHIHPVSRWLFKCWTADGCAHLIDGLSREGFKTVLTSGPADKERAMIAAILKVVKSRPVDILNALTLKRMSVLSRRAALFFGVDSAPMHIAAAVGTPVAAVFGPSGAFDWGPWDNKEIGAWFAANKSAPASGIWSPYPQRNGTQRFGRNLVIQMPWDCAPCGKDGCNGTKKSRCLDELDPDVVLKAVIAMLKGNAQGDLQ
ncbi:MAG: putative lipopolysaccharide heptosyltransferase III [Deltaproteobacteria bacterium]|nr:putative lipopolysaccharide heptosyltransferase III [Deltaproteobacteria bacterium]